MQRLYSGIQYLTKPKLQKKFNLEFLSIILMSKKKLIIDEMWKINNRNLENNNKK
jgi:hypothetical protein